MIEISTDKHRLNIDYIFSFLSQSYWANKRTIEQVKESINNSLCFGMYKEGKQIGFARVITDKVVSSYLMDVFIDEKHQHQGYGEQLIRYIYQHEDLMQVKSHYLITKDAQTFYHKFGFKVYPTPEKFMIKR